ncbi:siroheme synthase CysG [Rhodobaculum claviforme]|uniref:Uroporphyrinogen-III C-methyltransferase n=1 Tax=Rhodobaculum claviforme TaxID=1549854 RepID=A0A934WK83_9RHOB|nr:siroheme synthase CysG [Rhodobaculum claviforme]MBK5928288.1 uroporphyrinogen-III C-methyltransferase [Rhodobaculum claviforme]
MRHLPLFRDLKGSRVVVSGGGEIARSKLRTLLRTEARVIVFAADPHPEVEADATAGRLVLVRRPLGEGDAICAALVYGANGDTAEDARVAGIGRRAGALVNIVDDLEGSDFISPAIVDRDPVVVAIGTEGAAPVLARRIKADIEAMLPQALGPLARLAAGFRHAVEALPFGRPRRDFWTRYFDREGRMALDTGGEGAVRDRLQSLLDEHIAGRVPAGRVSLVGAGPGDPELLTLRARNRLHDADVIVHDQLVPRPILDLGRREALFIAVGKRAGGPSWRQADIDALLVDHARSGALVVRLKSGDAGVFGRLDEELDALDAAGVAWEIVPGVTSAMAAAAEIGRSMTRRDRNSAVTLATAQDAAGMAEHDWRALARPGAVTAIYMGVRAARFVQGRLMLHGADPTTPVSAVENAGRPERRTVATTLADLPQALVAEGIGGPAILFLGLAPRRQAAPAALPAAMEA